MATVAPYGAWHSPITADRLVEGTVLLSFPSAVGGTLYWSEGRPAEGGRVVIVRREEDGREEDVFGADYSARTVVHEYGGRSYVVGGDAVYFSNFGDQRLYVVRPGGQPEPMTPAPPSPASLRYAAPVLSPDGRRLYCVRERHGTPDVVAEVVNELVMVALDGDSEPHVVASGHDFFSFPTVSPDGRRLAWISWDHPNMPWDGTDLVEATLGDDGMPTATRHVAGGRAQSVTQPKYSPDGRLHFISDRTGWWNLYADDASGGAALAEEEAEFAGPDWVLGLSSYCFLADGTLAALWSRDCRVVLSLLRSDGRRDVPLPFSFASAVAPSGDGVVIVGGGPKLVTSVVALEIPSGRDRIVKAGRGGDLLREFLSEPEPIEFPTEGARTAHALYYPPWNPDFVGPPGEMPPVIVAVHGGPTGFAVPALNYGIQYWTSRGIGVVDVDYGGSAGYGRAYRERLKGKWGIVDLDDCVNAARYLVASGRADERRLLIHGGSAGGYTTLCALTFRQVFAAGASYYGVADAGALARHTHKFESHYSDGLIGPWPQARALYEERSPLFHADQLSTPLILFQGLEDRVVPPEQSEVMAASLREQGIPFAYVAYEGEQHGFRKSENIRRTAEAELSFLAAVLGFRPADHLPPLDIENAGALDRHRSATGGGEPAPAAVERGGTVRR